MMRKCIVVPFYWENVFLAELKQKFPELWNQVILKLSNIKAYNDFSNAYLSSSNDFRINFMYIFKLGFLAFKSE